MTGEQPHEQIRQSFYLFGSRVLTHILFWVGYYVLFSLVWVKPDKGYFASFYLEFVLLPARLAAVYAMIYVLMPRFLLVRQYGRFLLSYAGLIVLAGLVHRLSAYFFYEKLLFGQADPFFDLGALVRAVLLVNTTVVFVAAAKMFQLYLVEAEKNRVSGQAEQVAVRANRRTYLLDPADILYLESMGNYVSYFLGDGEKLVAHGSIKAALEDLPEGFIRLHRSYVVNKAHITAFNSEKVQVGETDLPRGKDVDDAMLTSLKPFGSAEAV
ncbi:MULTISPECIES: LytR/AlgR family response regulator transcription factor [Kordiimonas]|jgi:hypothetical protein|uniref:LytR/AlgR family response regulator transcription factor n=1 Tax=Kordiimonas TaxID=288021 RepID=UPI00257DB790|nr:LytTR family DNA-binding domain-containing protein [Kordiimonas sp. UBA4487]